jgi:PAS domain S-box-containing protein
LKAIISHQKQSGLISALIITLAAIGTISLVDSINVVTCAPVIGVCAMFILALRYPPRIMMICLIPLSLFVFFRLWQTLNVTVAPESLMNRYWIRITTFSTAGCIALVASAYRSRLLKVTNQLLRILEAIPLPLIISDSSGVIRAVSETTYSVTGLDRDQIIGFQLPDIVGSHLLEEADEDWYKHWLESPEGKIFNVELQLGNKRSTARVGRLGSGRHAFMIVIFL